MRGGSGQDRLDLNRCTAARLSAVTGIAADTASRIIAYRRRKKRLASVRDVLDVRGVTEKDLEMLRQSTQVRRLTSPRSHQAKTDKSPVLKKSSRRTATKYVPSPKQRSTKSQQWKPKPATSKKGTQTLETGSSLETRVKISAFNRKKGKTLPIKRTKASKVSKKPPENANEVRKPEKGNQSFMINRQSSPTGLLLCREADRLKASEGLDYVGTYGSPRPLLTLSSQGVGVQQAKAQINNCAITVHLMERAPLMSPMVTVNIPSCVLAESAGVVAITEDKSSSHETPSRRLDEDTAAQSILANGLRQRNEPKQSSPAEIINKNDQSNSNNQRPENEGDEAGRVSPVKIFPGDQQEGYLAGSETDHSPSNFLPNLPSPVDHTPISLTVGNDSEIIGSRPTGRRKTRSSHKGTAEKVQLWLENSSCSSSYFNPEKTSVGLRNLFDGEPKSQLAEKSLIAGTGPLPTTTQADDESEMVVQSSLGKVRSECKRESERERDLLTPVAGGAAGGNDKSVQTPPCSCRSCRRKRRARKRSAEAAGQQFEHMGTKDNFFPKNQEELSTAWCSLL
ncbi:uncharacterized protein LOC110979597 [Acanthaster planci]|uniref:Uncharacterized protein LOC110979597 n=1 Tax=Acanthaster planci TaxID=133434 RepID=A0A8B7YF78_ACAPL|nr:uncharacterized protein LOC110979597 [Acanthaster planci]